MSAPNALVTRLAKKGSRKSRTHRGLEPIGKNVRASSVTVALWKYLQEEEQPN